jgi:hypothetical protein
MEQKLWRIFLAVVSALALTGAWADAQQPSGADKPAAGTDKPAAGTANPDLEERAVSILGKAATFLAQEPHFSVTVETGYDAVQASGLKVEFGATRKYTIRRPDHVRIDTELRDGDQRGFRFDGKEIAVFDINQKVYATAEHPGTIEEAFGYFIDQLQMPLPLAELFSSTLPGVVDTTLDLHYVDVSTIAGVHCDHLVGRRKNIDFQVWIAQGDKPVFQRLILTYKREKGEPQFWAQFSDWNFSSEIPDSLFAFTPPEGGEKIPFAPRKVAATETTKPKGGSQ